MIMKPIIITGCQRSGTTLLRTLLGNHPDLIEHPQEPQFILELYQRFGLQIADVKTAVSYLIHHPYLPSSINKDGLTQAFSDQTSLTLAEFIQRYLRCWAGDALLTKRPVIKDPAFIFHLDLIEKLFPEATVMHIIRDPRAAVASQIVRWPQLSTVECAMLWCNALQSAKKWSQSSQQPYIEVHYEQLLQQPSETLQMLCHKLDIPYQATMQNFTQETTVFKPNAEPEPRTLTAVDPSRLHGWQDHLTSFDIQLIEQCCQQEMAQWQYEPTSLPLPTLRFSLWKIGQHSKYYVKQIGKTVKSTVRQAGWRIGRRS
ncbi:hypothetical protein MNBD_CHLOROFLEXI01-212 [hydrothermal vent metagenome]|uniref:Sulfotransferase n=1 Tax=hydrothermal vent metagenome TaxID=652676 RepID=A0A3B0UST1_9ZZZZ